MSVRFRPDRLEITDFRGIDRFQLQLRDGEPTVLVGANNTGKSTVLEAFALALKAGGMHTFTPEPFDFRLDAASSHLPRFSIKLWAEARDETKLPGVQGMGNPVRVHGVEVVGRTKKNGARDHTHHLLTADGKTITFSQRTPLKGDAKENFGEQDLGYRPVNARLDDIRDYIPEVWYLTPKNIEPHLYIWKTGPLKRLSDLLSDRFLNTEWALDYRGKVRQMPSALDAAHSFFQSAVREFPFWTDDLRPKLEDALTRYMGSAARFDLAPDIAAFESWLAQQLALAFAVEAGAPLTPLNRMGDGWQSLVRLAALDVLSQYPELMRGREQVTILFEEPETHLHPHLRRKLRHVLEQLADKGWIIILTTHSPEFVSFTSTMQIGRLARVSGTFSSKAIATADVDNALKTQERLDRGRSGRELPFCNRVVISEGQSDDLAIRLGLEKLGFDADGASLGIIPAGGVQEVPAFAKLAADLGVPWFAITDDDLRPDGTKNTNTERARTRLSILKSNSDETLVLKGRLEGALGLAGHGDGEEILAKLESVSLSVLRRDYPEFVAACEAVVRWANPAAPAPGQSE